MKFTFKEMQQRLNEASESEWSDSKLRYYLLEILRVKERKRGVTATYSAQTLGKLLFLARVMESPMQPTIKQALRLLEGVTTEELARIGEGTEQIEFGVPDTDASGERVYRTLSGQVAPQERHPFGRVMSVSAAEHFDHSSSSPARFEEAAIQPREAAADYVAREFARHLGDRAPAAAPEPKRDRWQAKIDCGPDLQIRCRKPLTARQEQQLRLAGELLRTILEEE
jgi:hypothetical protein